MVNSGLNGIRVLVPVHKSCSANFHLFGWWLVVGGYLFLSACSAEFLHSSLLIRSSIYVSHARPTF